MPTAPTWGDIFRDICAALHPDENLPVLGVASSTAADALEVIDNLRYTLGVADSDALENAYVHIDSKVGSGPEVGEFSVVDNAGLAIATGTISVTPAFGAAVEANALFSIWKKVEPEQGLRMMNRVARILRREQLVPISHIADAELEGSAAHTAVFDIVSGTPTLALEATNYHRGSQAVSIDDAGNGVWVVDLDNPVDAIQTQQYLLSVWIKPYDILTGIQVALWDETNGVNITPVGSHAERVYQEIALESLTVPDTCKQLNVRITALGATDSTYVDGVHLWNRDQAWWDLPSWVEDPADLLEIGYFRRGRNLNGDNAYTVDEREWVPWAFKRKQFVEESGGQPLRVHFDTPITRPLFARIARRWPVITTGGSGTFGDTTTVDRDLFRDLTLVHIYTELEVSAGQRGDKALEETFARAKETYLDLEHVRRFNQRGGELVAHINFPSRRR